MDDIINKIRKETSLEKILEERDKYSVGSFTWETINVMKAVFLEENKPSTKENILTFKEEDLKHIELGFNKDVDLNGVKVHKEKRSILEYNPIYRHPIPYVIVRHKDKYFFILREAGSGEYMLIGKKGMLGGHVGVEDLSNDNIKDSIFNGFKRELEEEAGIKQDMILNVQLKGLIKSNEGVDRYHLGFIYEIEINTLDIKSEEEGVLTGIWLNKDEISKHFETLENWSKIICSDMISL